jgi:hypothetical protein
MPISEEQLITDLRTVLKAIDEAGVPAALQPTAFGKLLDRMLGPPPASGPSAHTSSLSPRAIGASDQADGEPSLATAASRLRVDASTLARVLDFDEDGPHIMARRSQFDAKKSAATQEVARLVVGARQAAGLEEWTPLALVREACADLGVEDRSNFATHIKNLDGVRQRGTGKTGELKMNAVGFEQTKALVERLGGESS